MAITNADGSIVLTTKIDQTGLKKGMSTMKAGVSSTTSALGKLGKAVGLAFSVAAIVKFSKEASNLATTAEASVQRLIDIYGSASKTVGDFIDTNAQALGMSKAAAASFSSVYGNLFSVWADQKTNAELTNQYLQMTAVVASKTGRTVEDVQERIRSGLLGNTEAIEDLGVFVNIKTIEMTDAFQRMANGKSWEQLDAYTQQQIRTMAILEQATEKYGNEVAQTSALTKSQFRSAWQDFQATWGQAVNIVLIPILSALTKIIQVGTIGLQKIFGFSKRLLGDSEQQANALTETVKAQNKLTSALKKTEKAQKGVLAGFDDINILAGGSANSEAESGAGGKISITPIEINGTDDSASRLEIFVERCLTALEPLTNALKGLFDSVAPAFGYVYENVLLPFSEWFVEELSPASIERMANLFIGLEKILTVVGKGFKTVYEYMKPIFDWIGEAVVFLIEKIGKAYLEIGRTFEEKSPEIQEAFRKIGEIIEKVWRVIKPIFNWIVGIIADFVDTTDELVADVIDIFCDLISFIDNVFKGDWDAAWQSVLGVFKGIINLIVDALNVLIRGLNKIEFSLPNWKFLGDWAGAKVGINIPEIPRLAQGAVIPANREFLAVLGDQKQGTNIEAPAELIKKMAKEAIMESAINKTVKEEHYYLDEMQVMNVLYKIAKGGERIYGDSLVELGGY